MGGVLAAIGSAVVFNGGGRFSIAEGANPSAAELDAALTAAENGLQVTMKPPVGPRGPGGGTADISIVNNGTKVPYDIYTPEGTSSDGIISAIAARNDQAPGVVVDLRKTAATLSDLGNVMGRLNVIGATNIKEVIIIDPAGVITRLLRLENP